MGDGAVLRPRDLRAEGQDFAFEADEAGRRRVAEALGLEGLAALRLAGRLEPEGRADWRLRGTLTARATQSCVVTLEPVETAVEEAVERHYVEGLEEPEAGEVEMPDDEREPLPAAIDLAAVAAEALALALPPYPRAPRVELGEAVYAEPGVAPMTDEDARPFAGLAGLRDRMRED